MRVGVIRNDLSAPILAADLEQVSRRNSSVDAPGQVRYLHHPTDAELQKAMDDNGATGVTVAALKAVVYPTPTTINVSSAAILALGAWGGLASPVQVALVADIADAVAPKFAETDVAVESFLVGNLAGYASASFTPDRRRLPALALGPAIAVVEDDGVTVFSTAHTLPTVTSATLGAPSAGAITIAGNGLGHESGNATDPLRSTRVQLTGAVKKTLTQEAIEAAGGSVSRTAIVVPASLIPGAAVATTSVKVLFRQLASNTSAVV